MYHVYELLRSQGYETVEATGILAQRLRDASRLINIPNNDISTTSCQVQSVIPTNMSVILCTGKSYLRLSINCAMDEPDAQQQLVMTTPFVSGKLFQASVLAQSSTRTPKSTALASHPTSVSWLQRGTTTSKFMTFVPPIQVPSSLSTVTVVTSPAWPFIARVNG